MGSLADLRLPTEEVEIPGQDVTITVRGLSLTDASEILRRHGEALTHIYQTKVADSEDLPTPSVVAQALMLTAPQAVAEIIALANDNPQAVETVRRLPVPVQIDALSKIAALTFHSEAEVKKLAGTILLGSGVLTSVIKTLTEPEA